MGQGEAKPNGKWYRAGWIETFWPPPNSQRRPHKIEGHTVFSGRGTPRCQQRALKLAGIDKNPNYVGGEL